jgi:hypothetical protein
MDTAAADGFRECLENEHRACERRWELGEQLAARKLPAAATTSPPNSAAPAAAPRKLPTT